MLGPAGVLVARAALNASYLAEVLAKLNNDKTRQIIAQAAELLGREEIWASLTTGLLQQVIRGYEQELGALTNLLGLYEASPGYRPLVFGYSVGAMGGYLAELITETVGLGLVAEGVGAALPVLLKTARTSAGGARAAAALQRVSRFLMLQGDANRFARGFAYVIRFLDALGPDALAKWATQVLEIPDGAERVFTLAVRYGDQVDGTLRLMKIASGLTGDVATGARPVDNVVETRIVMQKMAEDVAYRGGDPARLITVSAENAEDFTRTLGRAKDLAAREPAMAAGLEGIFRNVEDVETLLIYMAEGGDDPFRGAAKLACPLP
jgi:hypothetical protein